MRWALLALLAVPAFAQLAPFNAAGVTMGHYHLMVPDVEAQKRIWVDVLGGELSGKPPLEFVKFPGVFLILSEGKGTEGTEGSAVEEIVFMVRDLEELRTPLVRAGVTIREETSDVLATLFPFGLKVIFAKDPNLKTRIEQMGFDIATTDREGERRWWSDAFGAETIIYTEYFDSTKIGSTYLLFTTTSQPRASTEGRSLDHTGVNVKNVDAYCTKLAGIGITCERPMGANTPIAMVTSPAGVRVEINEGLEKR